MTDFTIEHERFNATDIRSWSRTNVRHDDWPVVYTVNGSEHVYVGESANAGSRLLQHTKSSKAPQLDEFRVVLDETFNKSVCLDLETHLIRLFNADQKFTVLNKQSSSRNNNYYDRAHYRARFEQVFEALREQGLFVSDLETIENSNLFKLSPFTSLTSTQASAVEAVLDLIAETSNQTAAPPIVIQGDPGTGKTLVGIFLAKLLADARDPSDTFLDVETFIDDELGEARSDLRDLTIGFVVPQQSLRETIRRVFKATPSLRDVPVMDPFDVATSTTQFDVLIVDEAHRLQQFSGALQTRSQLFRDINRQFFPTDEAGTHHTQLDWVQAQCRVAVLLVDAKQSVRPMSDIPRSLLTSVISDAQAHDRHLTLWTQMRTRAGELYIDHMSEVLAGTTSTRVEFVDYDIRVYDDIRRMRADILERDAEVGLARMLAGFAWKWVSKNRATRDCPDINIDGLELFWNRAERDWINSRNAVHEVGCIHTSQGYDLNFAGVIIGPELRWDAATSRPVFVRANYHDKNGAKNNRVLGQQYSDDDLLQYVLNVYRVLLSRGIRGTYIYASDPALRERLRTYFPPPPPARA